MHQPRAAGFTYPVRPCGRADFGRAPPRPLLSEPRAPAGCCARALSASGCEQQRSDAAPSVRRHHDEVAAFRLRACRMMSSGFPSRRTRVKATPASAAERSTSSRFRLPRQPPVPGTRLRPGRPRRRPRGTGKREGRRSRRRKHRATSPAPPCGGGASGQVAAIVAIRMRFVMSVSPCDHRVAGRSGTRLPAGAVFT